MLESIVGATAASVLGTVGAVAGAVAGMGPVKEWLHGCKTRALAGRWTPGNHDLVKGVRTAHLCALDHVARRYTRQLAVLPDHEIGSDDHAFGICLRAFIDERLKPHSDRSIDHGTLTADDINHVLEQVVHAAAHESFAELSLQARAECEARALEELERDAGRKAPALFERVFKGEDAAADGAGWYGAFSLFVTEELKTNERFRSIFFATELVDIRRAVFALNELARGILQKTPDLSDFMRDIGQRLDRIEAGVNKTNMTLEEIASHLGLRNGTSDLDKKISRLETQLHATREDLIGLLAEIVGQGINPDQIDDALTAAKDNLEKSRAELERLRGLANEVPEIEPDLVAARNALNNPRGIDLAEAERAISAARSRYRAAIAARRDSEAINVARMLEAEASISLARSDYVKAAALLAEAADELPAFERALAAEFRVRQGDALHEHGKRFPGLESLREAIAAFDAALRVFTEQEMPTQWAMTRNDQGAALQTLGEREGGPGGLASLREAVVAYRATLRVFAEQDMPTQWAMTQNNLGAALQPLGEREGGPRGLASLRDAVAAFRAALRVFTEQDMPAQWSTTQSNLGAALDTLGEREGGPGGLASLTEAVAAFRAALRVRTERDTPAQWATTQNNLGNSLRTFGERESGPRGLASLGEAIAAYRAALRVFTEQDMPTQWAMTQSNLGAALQTLAERQVGPGGLASLREAVAAFDAALRVRTEQELPTHWAMTQNNLGAALQTLGEREGGPGGLASVGEAIAAFRAALRVFTEQDVPAQWAMTQNNLGAALRRLGDHDGGPGGLDSLREAVAAFRAALSVRTEQDMPTHWAMTQNNLGAAFQTLGEREGGPGGLANLGEAVAAFRAALRVFTEQDMPAQWAMTQNNLGAALQALGKHEGEPSVLACLGEAVAAYRAALRVFTEQDMPNQWAMTLGNQGASMRNIAELTADPALARQALGQIEKACETLRQAGNPYAHYYEDQADKARSLVAGLDGGA